MYNVFCFCCNIHSRGEGNLNIIVVSRCIGQEKTCFKLHNRFKQHDRVNWWILNRCIFPGAEVPYAADGTHNLWGVYEEDVVEVAVAGSVINGPSLKKYTQLSFNCTWLMLFNVPFNLCCI